jgi:hypothetical protein
VGGLVALHVVTFAFLPIATIALGCALVLAARVDLAASARTPHGFAQVVMAACGFSAIVLALVAFASVEATSVISLAALACIGTGLVLAGGGILTALRLRKHEAWKRQA